MAETHGQITTKDRIDILLKEYDTLRADILLRTNNTFTLMGISGAVLTWLLSRDLGLRFWLLLLVVCTVFGLIYVMIFQNMRRAAYRLMEIERQINQLVGGAPLLMWERHWGGASAEFFTLFGVFRATRRSQNKSGHGPRTPSES